MSESVIVIPARYGSTRFPGKPLASLWGKPVIQHVYERAIQSQLCKRVIVATDDERISSAASSFGAEVVMTRLDHATGSDRVAEVVERLTEDVIVNVQGDEPLVDPNAIDAATRPLLDDPDIPMSTPCAPFERTEDLANPNIVKVVVTPSGFALYFSRLPIPFVRDQGANMVRYRHIGLYAYRRDFLLRFAQLSTTPLEAAEKLEQLRALEHGYRVRVVAVDAASPGIDTPEDLSRLQASPPDSVS